MPRPPRTFRQHCQISELCPIFDAVLHPLHEEGVALHFVHERPVQVVINEQGKLLPRTDRQLAIILGVERSSKLLPHMEDDLALQASKPFESLYLAFSVGRPELSLGAKVLNEASRILLDLAGEGTSVKVVAVSHRRLVQGAIVLRHYLVALFNASGELLWAHPAGSSYGLIRFGFPASQKVRTLGRRSATWRPELRRLDPETGLPGWYRYAADQVQDEADEAMPPYGEVIVHQANLWVEQAMAENAEQALISATKELLDGFETFFGMGGLRPIPGHVELA